MSHSYLTFIFPTTKSKRDDIEAQLDLLSNPSSKALREALKQSLIVHFMSSALVYGDADSDDYLVVEMSVDGTPDNAVQIFDTAEVTALFDPLFSMAGHSGQTNSAFLLEHRLETGQGYFQSPGLNFSGTPGMSVRRIRDEYRFARRIRDYFDETNSSGTTLEIVQKLRQVVEHDDQFNSWKKHPYNFKPMLDIEPTSLLTPTEKSPTAPSVVLGTAFDVIKKLMWPALILAGVIAFFCLPETNGVLWSVWGFVWRFGLWSLGLIVLSTIGFAAALLLRENSEQGDLSLPDMNRLTQVRQREDQGYMQNHLFGVSRMKPGILRKISIRLTFTIIAGLAGRAFRPGYLADINTIHFARWFTIPGTDKLIFCSNYGGSWESYLEDFINKAADGLTGVWSNSFGFPPATLLFFKGATSGEEFKRWARRQQIPTRLFYSAYPHVTTDRIRINASIRKGLASAATEDEADAFLSLFASQKRPDSDVERDEIQTLMFGGLAKHEQSACILLRLPGSRQKAKTWLSGLHDTISFGGAPDDKRVNQISLSATGLQKMGLPPETLDQFSFPFQQGMSHPDRSRALADTGEDKPEKWNWGYDSKSVDCAYMIYLAVDPEVPVKSQRSDLQKRLTSEVKMFEKTLEQQGGKIIDAVVTTPLSKRRKSDKGNGHLPREPFGFIDGVSQPVIKGMRRGQPEAGNHLHLSEPGEFLLGYPDNRGTKTLLPTLSASKDPANILPVYEPGTRTTAVPDFASSGVNAARAFGRNGSYLVIRQLAQDEKAFSDFVIKAEKHVRGHKGIPKGFSSDQTREFLAAKMVGRWKDGTSLVKFPYKPGTGWDGKTPNREPDNAFLPGTEDPTGTSCPYGSHIRRSNPRDSFLPHDQTQLDIVNRHRILRRGRFYETKDGKKDAGLLFMCVNADIERQFEFIQQTWCMAPQFMGLENEVDPILGRGGTMGRVTIPTPQGPIFLKGSPDAVSVIGGEYFFLPSKSALKYLAS